MNPTPENPVNPVQKTSDTVPKILDPAVCLTLFNEIEARESSLLHLCDEKDALIEGYRDNIHALELRVRALESTINEQANTIARLMGYSGLVNPVPNKSNTVNTIPHPKPYNRIRSLAELKAECRKRGWKIDTTRHDRDGHDHVMVQFTINTLGQPVVGDFLYNTFNGRFFGELQDGSKFDSQNSTHDHCGWFQILLGAAYTNDPISSPCLRASVVSPYNDGPHIDDGPQADAPLAVAHVNHVNPVQTLRLGSSVVSPAA